MKPYKAYDNCWYIVENDKVTNFGHFNTENEALAKINSIKNPKKEQLDSSIKVQQAKQIIFGNELKRYNDK